MVEPIDVEEIAPWQPKAIDTARRPGALRGNIRIADDFDEFTAQDEKDWYGE